ncbi:hypothetical protein ACJX0J_020718, partial [Zea mays]
PHHIGRLWSHMIFLLRVFCASEDFAYEVDKILAPGQSRIDPMFKATCLWDNQRHIFLITETFDHASTTIGLANYSVWLIFVAAAKIRGKLEMLYILILQVSRHFMLIFTLKTIIKCFL